MEKYKKIYEELYYAIKSGKYANGDVQPSEQELCERHGVSRITAKHALDLLREKGLVKRIRRRGTVVAAQDLFVRQTRGFVAVVFPHFENCGNRIYHGLRELAERERVSLSFFDTERSPEKEREILSFLLTQNVLGMILMPLGRVSNIDLLSQFSLHKIPLAFLDFAVSGIRAPLVTSDNFGGMYALTQYLIRRGHRKIAYYPYSDAFLPTEAERFRGYCAALIDSGIAIVPEYFLAGSLSPVRSAGDVISADFQSAKRAADVIFHAAQRPTAVVCVNDVSAHCLAAAVEARGLSVPRDLSVTGFDNLSASISENITTVGQNFGEIARNALTAVLLQLEKGVPAGDYVVRVPTVLVERSSVRSPE